MSHICEKRWTAMMVRCSDLRTIRVAQCPHWRNALIYDMVRVSPDSSQEHNALIPHPHEYHNHWDLWQSLPCSFIQNISRKACCYENHGNGIRVGMGNIPMKFLSRGHMFPAMNRISSCSEKSEIPTSQRRPVFIIVFLWYLPILLYT